MKRRSFLKKAAAGVAAGTVAAPAIAQSQPDHPVAHALQLAEEPGHPVRRRRAGRPARRRDHRRQVPDPRLRRGRDRAGAAGARCGPGRHRRVRPHRAVLLLRQGSRRSRSAPRSASASTRASRMPGGSSAAARRRWRRCSRSTASSRCSPATPAARWAAGAARRSSRVADLKGLKMRIGGMAGLILAKLGVVPQQIGAPRHLPGAREGHDRRAPSGSARTTTRSSASTRSPSSTTTRASGKAARCCMRCVNEKKWNELPKPYQAALETACGEATTWMPAKYDAQNPPALRRLVAGGTQLRPFPRSVMEAAEKASYEVYDEMSGQERALQAHLSGVEEVPRRAVPVVPRRRADLRQLHASTRKIGQPAAKPAAKKKA